MASVPLRFPETASRLVVRRRTVRADGVELAVFEQGDPTDQTILLVHGFPDTNRLWDGVAERLAETYHVVRYDVRGAGESTAPRERGGYTIDKLAEDLFAVADAVSPEQSLHLVAHDWGSIQAWDPVTDPRAARRIASFTSISGPSLDHAAFWLRGKLSRPTPANLAKVLRQAVSSWYIYLHHLPVLPALAWRTLIGPNWATLLERVEGIKAAAGHPAPTMPRDAARGVKLYTANMLPRLRKPAERRTEVPVQLIIPTRDKFVSPDLSDGIERWVGRVWRRRLVAGHWAPASHPDAVARMVDEFVDHVDGRPMTRGLQRATGADDFTHRLVVITGAGRGIGQATARAFAARGAEVVVADLDLAAAKETAASIGPAAYPYQVDVADEAAMRAFAEAVAEEHGVPDVVVNNAGIGMAGAFLDTTTDEWRRVLDVNLLGVVHGCQVFGALMAEHGEGGTIVNLASAAAYTPHRAMSAYAASKAAVLMLSDCVRAELAEHGISVSAICPGIVATDITNTTRFAGKDDVEQQRLRQKATKSYARRGFGPERVATEIVRAVERGTAVVPVTTEAKIARLGARFAPGLMRAAARMDVVR
ncbi:MAG TPA: SDR family oxidoreductase [Actinokineospora sp.]|nr:SDR family oxidoreductase [Actinokineospora sp.]